MTVPKYDELFNPLLEALRNLGGSASIPEQEDEVASILKLSEKDLAEIHRGNRTKFSYRLAWARNYLKRFGLLENSTRGVWSLTVDGHKTNTVDKNEVKRFVIALNRKAHQETENEIESATEAELTWQEELLDCIRSMTPDAYSSRSNRTIRRWWNRW